MSNIAFLNNSGSNGWGGVENWIFKTAVAFNKRNHNIFIIARDNSKLYKKSTENDFKTKKINRLSSASFVNPFIVFKLYKYFKKNKIDTIFFCSSPTFKVGTIAAKLAGVENIIYRRGSAKPIKNKFYNKILLNKISCFIANSNATKERSLKYFKKFPVEKIKLIYNGVELDNYVNIAIEENIYSEFNLDPNKLLLINVGRLSRQKGQEYLIYAANKLKNNYDKFNLLLVGTGPKEDELKEIVDKLDLKNYIKFAGFRKDIPELLSQADFMVHTALWEGCPWAVLEALAAGLPVLATDSSSLPEIIEESINGCLALDKNIKDISEKMLMMCKDADLESLSKGARKSAEKRFNFNRVIKETESCFK